MIDLKDGIWSELKNNKSIDVYRRNLQKSFISRLGYIMKNEQPPTRPGWGSYITSIKVDVSDIRSITMGTLLELKKDLNKAVKRYSDKVLKSHLSYCIAMIDDAMMSS